MGIPAAPVPYRPKVFDDEALTTEIVGEARRPLRSLYRWLMVGSWGRLLGVLVLGAFTANLLFGAAYWMLGGITNARPGSFWDAFFFSVHTLGTIGYGSMYPQSEAAQVLVSIESVTGTVLTALATGMVFSKFSAPRVKIEFTSRAVVCSYDGTPTLMFRVRSERGALLVDARLRVMLMRADRTKEGHFMYRFFDLPLVRDHSPRFSGSWTIMHHITPQSPLFGRSREQLAAEEAEIVVSLLASDSSTGQRIHAQTSFLDSELGWGERFEDIMAEIPNSPKMLVNLANFDKTRPETRA